MTQGNLKTELCQLFTREIMRLPFTDDHLPQYYWDNVSRRLLCFIVEEKLLTKATICTLVHRRILEIGRENYKENVKHDRYPDYPLASPEALAYALAQGEFSQEEKDRLRFDHGDTLDTFVSQYCKEMMVEKLYTQLVTEVKEKVWGG